LSGALVASDERSNALCALGRNRTCDQEIRRLLRYLLYPLIDSISDHIPKVRAIR
jgi:hypothetical protein